MNTVQQLNPSVKRAVKKLAPLLHHMHRANLLETLDSADSIRKTLSEQDQSKVIAVLICMHIIG